MNMKIKRGGLEISEKRTSTLTGRAEYLIRNTRGGKEEEEEEEKHDDDGLSLQRSDAVRSEYSSDGSVTITTSGEEEHWKWVSKRELIRDGHEEVMRLFDEKMENSTESDLKQKKFKLLEKLKKRRSANPISPLQDDGSAIPATGRSSESTAASAAPEAIRIRNEATERRSKGKRSRVNSSSSSSIQRKRIQRKHTSSVPLERAFSDSSAYVAGSLKRRDAGVAYTHGSGGSKNMSKKKRATPATGVSKSGTVAFASPVKNTFLETSWKSPPRSAGKSFIRRDGNSAGSENSLRMKSVSMKLVDRFTSDDSPRFTRFRSTDNVEKKRSRANSADLMTEGQLERRNEKDATAALVGM